MEKVIKAVSDCVTYHSANGTESVDMLPVDVKGLQSAASAFATMALAEFRDELLKKALAVSVSLADFVAEYRESIKP